MGQSYLSTLTEHIDKGDLDVVKTTLPNVGNLNEVIIHKKSLIAYTASQGGRARPIMEYLLKQNIDVNAVGPDGRHALGIAVENDFMDIVQLLVSYDADFNYVDSGDDTPLALAVKNDNYEIAKFLVEKGANVNKTGLKGKTPLSYAVQNRNKVMMDFLLKNGASYTIHTALLDAISKRDLELVQYLQSKGAQVNLESVDGYTPLIKAVEVENYGIVKFLVEKGANIGQKDRHERSPLSVAAANQDMRIFDYLVATGGDVNEAIKEIGKVENLNMDFEIYLKKLKNNKRGIMCDGSQEAA